MGSRTSRTGQVSALVFVGVLVLAIPAGLTLAQDSAFLSPDQDPATARQDHGAADQVAIPTALPGTATENGTATPTPEGDATLRVDDDRADPTTEGECPAANHATIQAAVDNASTGDTVVVCTGTYEEGVVVGTGSLTIAAHGDASITGTGQPAFEITAPQVTVRGFTLDTGATNRTVVVGARGALIQNATFNVSLGATETGPAVGVFLSDGRTASGAPDPALASATGSVVVNSTFDVSTPPESDESAFAVWADADRTTIRDNSFTSAFNASSVVSTGNGTVIRNNDILHPNPQARIPFSQTQYPQRAGIQVGATFCFGGQRSIDCTSQNETITNVSAPAHDWAIDNLVVGNSIDGAPRNAILLLEKAGGTTVRNNDITNIQVHALNMRVNDTLIESNTITNSRASAIRVLGYDIRVVGNNATDNEGWGITVGGAQNVLVKGNTLRQNTQLGGIFLGAATSGLVVNNTIVNNDNGIQVYFDPPNNSYAVEAHHNRIMNNSGLGIFVQNPFSTDDEWPIFNATNNVWGCGGPSGGLRDPYTNRTANGTGDSISAGDRPGYSNVHFDPFQEVSGCPSLTPSPAPTSTSNPTGTGTSSPTPALTATGTETATVTGTATGTSGGSGTGPGGGNGTATGPGSGQDGDTGDVTTPEGTVGGGGTPLATLSPTATPQPTPTPTQTPPVTPNEQVEPGFGVVVWLLGAVVLAGLLAVRRRSDNEGAGRGRDGR